MKQLSAKRIRLLQAIGRYQVAGQFPLATTLAQELGLKRQTSIDAMLAALEREQYVARFGGGPQRRPRVYQLTAKGEAVVPEVLQQPAVPVLGSIPAGPLTEAVQSCETFIHPGDGLKVLPGDFFLIVKGDSMTGDGILPQDLVLLRPDRQVRNGGIAAVQIKGENGAYDATLKHVHFQPGKRMVRLKASNPTYDDLVVPAKQVEIVGVYRGLIRRTI